MTTVKIFLIVENEGTVPQIFIQRFISSGWFFEGNTDKRAKSIPGNLGDQEETGVVINSNGGGVFQGIAIGDLLKSNRAKVNAAINGSAASAASIIAMVSDTIKTYDDTQLMIHRASIHGEGNIGNSHTIADQLELIDKSVKASYKTRFNDTDEALQELLEKESFMDAETALSYGSVDETIDAENSSGIEAKKEQSVEEILNDVKGKRTKKIAAFTTALNKTFGQGDVKQ